MPLTASQLPSGPGSKAAKALAPAKAKASAPPPPPAKAAAAKGPPATGSAEGFARDIESRKLPAVQARLAKKEKATQFVEAGHATLLHVAVRAGDPAIVAALLAAGADVAAADSEGATPLHWAARSASAEAGAVAGVRRVHARLHVRHASALRAPAP